MGFLPRYFCPKRWGAEGKTKRRTKSPSIQGYFRKTKSPDAGACSTALLESEGANSCSERLGCEKGTSVSQCLEGLQPDHYELINPQGKPFLESPQK